MEIKWLFEIVTHQNDRPFDRMPSTWRRSDCQNGVTTAAVVEWQVKRMQRDRQHVSTNPILVTCQMTMRGRGRNIVAPRSKYIFHSFILYLQLF